MHATEKHYNAYSKIIGGYGVSLALKLVKNTHSLHKLYIVLSTNSTLKTHQQNKQSYTQWSKHTNNKQIIFKGNGKRGIGLASRAWVG